MHVDTDTSFLPPSLLREVCLWNEAIRWLPGPHWIPRLDWIQLEGTRFEWSDFLGSVHDPRGIIERIRVPSNVLDCIGDPSAIFFGDPYLSLWLTERLQC